MLIKWNNITIGEIKKDNSVEFKYPRLNPVVLDYTKGKNKWTESEFKEFLSDRIISKDRRDIEKILFRCKLVDYDIFKIAYITRALNSKDLIWIAKDENEQIEAVMQGLFENIFLKKVDVEGDSVKSPDGVNIKRYGVSNGYYGIFKKRLTQMSTDIESEVAVFNLSRLLGVRCCPAWLVRSNKDFEAFSKFEYNFGEQYVVHCRRLIKPEDREENEYLNLIKIRPMYKVDIQRMVILDFVTRQEDRHLSNIAELKSSEENYMYPLYDNGRSLFYENSEEFIEKAINNVELYVSEFGPVGTYLDAIQQIILDTDIREIVNLNIKDIEIKEAYELAGIKGSRLEGSILWTIKTLNYLRGM